MKPIALFADFRLFVIFNIVTSPSEQMNVPDNLATEGGCVAGRSRCVLRYRDRDRPLGRRRHAQQVRGGPDEGPSRPRGRARQRVLQATGDRRRGEPMIPVTSVDRTGSHLQVIYIFYLSVIFYSYFSDLQVIIFLLSVIFFFFFFFFKFSD